MYAQTQQAASAAGRAARRSEGRGGGRAAGADDDVVDAEIVETRTDDRSEAMDRPRVSTRGPDSARRDGRADGATPGPRVSCRGPSAGIDPTGPEADDRRDETG